MEHKRPKIFVSKCLEHEACRYDGSMIASPFVAKLKHYVDMVVECPEVASGMSVPRQAIRLKKEGEDIRVIESLSGNDHTDQMARYRQGLVPRLEAAGIHGAILKSRSPSCGIKEVKIYDGPGKIQALQTKTGGFIGNHLVATFEGLPIEDEGRLMNYNIRDHFLTRIYTLAAFDAVKAKGTMKDLVTFMSDNKYLLMAYHQANQKILGKLVANHDKKPVDQVFTAYEKVLKQALAKPLLHGRNTNMLLHIFGYFSKDLNAEEKAYFLETLAAYNDHKVPITVPISLLKAWVIRFDMPYLKRQTIFEPYPVGILDVTDSGKGID